MRTLIIVTFATILFSCNDKNAKKETTTEATEQQKEIVKNIWDNINSKEKWFNKDSKIYYSIDSLSPDFVEFYENFISKTDFQKEHIKFPILAVIGECDTTILLNESNWENYDHDFRKDFYNELDSNIIYQSETKFNFKNYRKEIGLLFQIGFEKIDGKWYLTLYEVNAC